MSTIAVLGTLDSKGTEHAFVAEQIRARGHDVLLIDVGTGGEPEVSPEITRFEVADAGGDFRLVDVLVAGGDQVHIMTGRDEAIGEQHHDPLRASAP